MRCTQFYPGTKYLTVFVVVDPVIVGGSIFFLFGVLVSIQKTTESNRDCS